jgi:hypothetical protein
MVLRDNLTGVVLIKYGAAFNVLYSSELVESMLRTSVNLGEATLREICSTYELNRITATL